MLVDQLPAGLLAFDGADGESPILIVKGTKEGKAPATPS